ncbi:Sodium-dependent transporter [Candidatus Hepatincolaceae symbiont of Richtersius coronifer]
MANLKDNNWSSKLGFVLAASGSAVGLGNIWRFPYLVAENGGGTFIFLYFLCSLGIALAILLAEFTLGRMLGQNMFTAFNNKTGRFLLNGMPIVVSTTILSFYFVVCGWIVFYFVQSLTGQISYSTNDSEYYNLIFKSLLASPFILTLCTCIFIFLTIFINYKGVVQGVERTNLFLLPMLFIILIIMILRVLTLEGASEGVKYVFSFDYNYVTSKALMAALGQAFFSLSIGIGTMLIYSSYVKKDYNLKSSATYTVLIGSGIGIFTSLLIIPAVFAFNYDPNSGPGLTFITLPAVFANLKFGFIFAALLFLIMGMAAITSTISLVEAAVPALANLFKLTRKQAILCYAAICVVISTIQGLAFNKFSGFTIFGKNTFDFAGNFSDYLLTFGAFIVCIVVGWILPKAVAINEVTNNGTVPFKLVKVWLFILKYIAPSVIIIIVSNMIFKVL